MVVPAGNYQLSDRRTIDRDIAPNDAPDSQEAKGNGERTAPNGAADGGRARIADAFGVDESTIRKVRENPAEDGRDDSESGTGTGAVAGKSRSAADGRRDAVRIAGMASSRPAGWSSSPPTDPGHISASAAWP